MSKAPPTPRHDGILKLHRNAIFGEVSSLPVHAKKPGKSPRPRSGTAHAINYLILGVPAYFGSERSHGGARNRADRESQGLTAPQIINLVAAARHADAIGLPLNRMVTIHWQAAGLPLLAMAKATGRFTDMMAKALARNGARTAWLWVHENGDGKGGHCHMLAHIPAGLVDLIGRRQREWLKRITGQPYRRGVIHSKPIGGRLGLEEGNSDLHAVNLQSALSYVLKGATEPAATLTNHNRLEPGGRIIGKRCGTSQNIGAKARANIEQKGSRK
ncbi:hypothetical protein O4H52_14770 [Sphingomonadaceae bacterium G21617-S1]|nr:hypothetical protein [Sphingomonadaceae bacterium G21617-S1]